MTFRIVLGISMAFAAAPLGAQVATPPSTAATPAPQKAALPGAPAPAPAAQQAPAEPSRNAPVNGVLVLFGNEKCPTDAGGNEIVVCTRRSANEQYRIPKEMRDFKVTPQNEAWAARLAPVMEAGAAGTGSCTTVGPGGSTGCFLQQAQAARRENKEKKAEEARIP